MAIDFTLSPELEAMRLKVRDFIQTVVRPGEEKIGDPDKLERSQYLNLLLQMREDAKAAGLWLPLLIGMAAPLVESLPLAAKLASARQTLSGVRPGLVLSLGRAVAILRR